METQEEFNQRLAMIIGDTDQMIRKANDYLISKGTVLDLTQWVTIKEYCKRFKIKNSETVSNWLKRGIIPAEDTVVIEELNNIRLIRAKPYNVRNAKATV